MLGPYSPYSFLYITISLKEDMDENMDPPVQAECSRREGEITRAVMSRGANIVKSLCNRSEKPAENEKTSLLSSFECKSLFSTV